MVVDTASPCTYFSSKAFDRLLGLRISKVNVPQAFMYIQVRKIGCHRSPVNSHFSEVNILGMDAMCNLRLQIQDLDWDKDGFKLTKQPVVIEE